MAEDIALNNEIAKDSERAVIPPMSFLFFPVISGDGTTVAYFGRVALADKDYGVMPCDLYQEAIKGTGLEKKIISWQLERWRQLHSEYAIINKELPNVILSLPDSVFEDDYYKDICTKLDDMPLDLKDKLCFAVSNFILYEEKQKVLTFIDQFKQRGVKIALNYFGDEYIAPLKLKSLNFEYIIFTSEFSIKVADGEKEESLLGELLQKLDYKCILQNRVNEEYHDIKGEFKDGYYEINGLPLNFDELMEEIVAKDLFNDIDEEVMEKYHLSELSLDEAIKVIMGVELPEEEVKENKEEQTKISIDRSFVSRLVQSSDQNKEFYSAITSHIMQFEKLSENVAWKHHRFHRGRNTVAKLTFRGKTMCLYLALKEEDVKNPKYKIEFVNDKVNEKTPCLIKINGPRKSSYSLELIDLMFNNMGVKFIEKSEEELKKDKEISFESTLWLKHIGLIKEKKNKVKE